MARVNHETINKIKSEIDFVAYLRDHKYEINHAQSNEKITVFGNKKTEYKISVFTNPDGRQAFKDFKSDRKGSIIDFVQAYEGKTYGEAIHYLNDILNTGINRIKYNQIKQESVFKKELYPDNHFNFDNLIDTRYLNSRGFENNVIYSPLFRGRIGQKQLMSKNNKPYHVTVFPMYKNLKDTVRGLEIKSNFRSGSYIGSEKQDSFWRSNYIKNPNQLVITESPLDAMAHFQLNQTNESNKRNIYIATNGALGEDRIKILSQFIDNYINRFKGLTLAFDKDSSGERFSINLIGLLKEKENDLKFQITKHGINNAKLQVTGNINTLNKIKTHIEKANENNIYSDIEIDSKQTTPTLLLKTEHNRENLSSIKNILLQYKGRNINITQSINKDFTKDLEVSKNIIRTNKEVKQGNEVYIQSYWNKSNPS